MIVLCHALPEEVEEDLAALKIPGFCLPYPEVRCDWQTVLESRVLQLCTADNIAFLAAGDVLLPNAVSTIREVVSSSEDRPSIFRVLQPLGYFDWQNQILNDQNVHLQNLVLKNKPGFLSGLGGDSLVQTLRDECPDGPVWRSEAIAYLNPPSDFDIYVDARTGFLPLDRERIEGWFNFGNIYADMVSRMEDGAVFVEIGSWMGRSTTFMAEQIRDSGKNIKFFAVDMWKGSSNEGIHREIIAEHNGTVFPIFLKHIAMTGLFPYIHPLIMSSVDASHLFADESLDFVFIDAGHTYEDVYRDLRAWYPKVKPGGVFAGHDYTHKGFPGVAKAVHEFIETELHDTFEVNRASWVFEKKGKAVSLPRAFSMVPMIK